MKLLALEICAIVAAACTAGFVLSCIDYAQGNGSGAIPTAMICAASAGVFIAICVVIAS